MIVESTPRPGLEQARRSVLSKACDVANPGLSPPHDKRHLTSLARQRSARFCRLRMRQPSCIKVDQPHQMSAERTCGWGKLCVRPWPVSAYKGVRRSEADCAPPCRLQIQWCCTRWTNGKLPDQDCETGSSIIEQVCNEYRRVEWRT